MERGEPALVPEWLKINGNLTGGNSTAHSGDHIVTKFARTKSFVNDNGHDLGHSSILSSFRWSSSCNGSGHTRTYNSFGRNQRDREREKDTYDLRGKEKSNSGDCRYQDVSALSIKFERDGLRRSPPMISGKPGDMRLKQVSADVSNSRGNKKNGKLTNGGSVGTGIKTIFERDFPYRGGEERLVAPEVGRVPSPGLGTAIQTLPIASATVHGEKWTSALAEVPVLDGNNETSLPSVQQATASPMSMFSGSSTSLNMAEAVAQGPHCSQSTPQLFVGTQRLEELAIKQSRQLIPVTPSIPKLLVSTGDKHKSKAGQRQYPISSPLPGSNSPRGGPVKDDVSKASNVGKLHVLKPVRERTGVSAVVKENTSPTSSIRASRSTNLAAPSGSASGTTRSASNNPVIPSTDPKPVLAVLEKLPTSQAQSRKDFFNLMKKKSVTNSSCVAGSPTMNCSSVLDTCNPIPSSSNKHEVLEVPTFPIAPQACDVPSKVSLGTDNHLSRERGELTCNGDTCGLKKYVSAEKEPMGSDPLVPEEEAAFLRSLGWEENSDEGGLTEEEISSFYKDVTKHINSKPPKAYLGVQPKFLSLFDSQVGGLDGLSSSAKFEC